MWPFVAVPALSPTIMCSHMLAGASAASTTMGSVVEDVKTVTGASTGAALPLEMAVGASCFAALAPDATIVCIAHIAKKNAALAGGV